MPDVEVTVIGAGVVGLAIAARLAQRHSPLVILEKNARHGMETSSRNSEVIHAGIYYPAGSLKARLCVEGNRRLYEIGDKHRVPLKRIGKIITAAVFEELPALDDVLKTGKANGAELRRLTVEETHALEPNIRTVGAVFSKTSGIVSAHDLMDFFLRRAEEAGAIVKTHSSLIDIGRGSDGYELTARTGRELESFTAERVINAAGLWSDEVAAMVGIDVDAAGYRLRYCKGSYFAVSPTRPGFVSRLVYPVPGPESLGLHAVLDLIGRLRFGPDVEYLADRNLDYVVHESRRPAFGKIVRHVFPAIRDEELVPDIAGIRPKLQGKGEAFRDFVITDETERGLPGFIDLIGIDSPGLTASPAIAELVATILT